MELTTSQIVVFCIKFLFLFGIIASNLNSVQSIPVPDLADLEISTANDDSQQQQPMSKKSYSSGYYFLPCPGQTTVLECVYGYFHLYYRPEGGQMSYRNIGKRLEPTRTTKSDKMFPEQ